MMTKYEGHKTTIISNIPIFITVRGNSDENIKKHQEALKFAYIFIKEQDLFLQTYIISAVETFIVSYLANQMLARKIKKIDMVSSLKGNE